MSNNGAPGVRFQHQLLKEGRGGLNYYPISGLVSGANITLDNRFTSGAFAVQVDVTAGVVVLDNVKVNVPAINNLVIPGQLGPNDTFDIYIKPDRKVQLRVGSNPAPTTRADGTPLEEGDLYLSVTELQEQNNILYHIGKIPFVYRYTSGVWVEYKDSTFAPQNTVGQQNAYRFGEVLPTLHSAATNNRNFSSTPEPFVFYPTGLPPYIVQPSHGYAREDGSLKLATIELATTNLPIISSADLVNASTTITVPASTARSLRIIQAANGNVMPTLAIVGTGIPASTTVATVHPTNNTATISNAATATTTSTVTISHATATYAIAANMSKVNMTTNVIVA